MNGGRMREFRVGDNQSVRGKLAPGNDRDNAE
jgi:hypothetical protein